MSAKSWYKKNYTPDQIKEIQRTLGVEEDGLIGPDTLRAIKEYQEAVGLKADGLWGKATQAKADEWNDEYNSFVPNRTVSNPNKELYKEYAKNLDKKYWLDEQNKYESNFKPNYEMSNVELAYLNKEIDKVKKQLADRQAKYESVPTPKTQVGWGSYIVNNDRGMLDKYQDAERAWYNKLIDQAHAKELAKAQMEQQNTYQMDDNMKNRSLALNKLELAKSNLKNDTSNDRRTLDGYKKEFKDAIDELNYWNKRVGIESYKDEDKLLDKEINGESTAIKNVDYSAIDSFDTQAQKDATLREIEANPAFKTDEKLRGIYNTLKDIKPKDVKKADSDAKLKKAQSIFDKLPNKIEKYIYLDNHPEYDVKDGKLIYKVK